MVMWYLVTFGCPETAFESIVSCVPVLRSFNLLWSPFTKTLKAEWGPTVYSQVLFSINFNSSIKCSLKLTYLSSIVEQFF